MKPLFWLVLLIAVIGGSLYYFSNDSYRTHKRDLKNQHKNNNHQLADYASIPEWNVQFKTSLSDVIYSISTIESDDTSREIADFSTSELVELTKDAEFKCRAEDAALGALVRSKEKSDFIEKRGQKQVLIGGYFYYYEGPQATCSADEAINDIEANSLRELNKDLLTTLRRIK